MDRIDLIFLKTGGTETQESHLSSGHAVGLTQVPGGILTYAVVLMGLQKQNYFRHYP